MAKRKRDGRANNGRPNRGVTEEYARLRAELTERAKIEGRKVAELWRDAARLYLARSSPGRP